MLDRIDGDIETLSRRIAQVRTWTFIANRPDWLRDPEHWQGETRRVEDRLSDALHERLASRFVDRRTSVLMRRLRENTMLEAEITADGDVTVEGQHVGHLHGFRFVPDAQAEGHEAKTLRSAAEKGLAGEIEAARRARSPSRRRRARARHDGHDPLAGAPVAKLAAGDKHLRAADAAARRRAPRRPGAREGRAPPRRVAQGARRALLGPLTEIETADDLTGIARGIGFQIVEALGVLERASVAQEMRTLDQDGRAALRRYGVRFGAYHLFLPALLKPAPRTLAAQLWALKQRRARTARSRRDRPSGRLRPHLDQGRSRDRQGALPRRGLPRLRRAGRARRHPGAARRPDPSGRRLPARHDAGRRRRRARPTATASSPPSA